MEKNQVYTINAVVVEGSKCSLPIASGDLGRVTRLASDLFSVLTCSLEVVDEHGRIVCALVRCTRPGDTAVVLNFCAVEDSQVPNPEFSH